MTTDLICDATGEQSRGTQTQRGAARPAGSAGTTRCSAGVLLPLLALFFFFGLLQTVDAIAIDSIGAPSGDADGRGVPRHRLADRGIVGSDSRYRIPDPASPPFHAIVKITMSTAAGNSSCTGVLISRELVLTLASCVLLPRDVSRGLPKPSWVYGIKVQPVSKRRAGATVVGVSAVHLPQRYLSAASTAGYSRDAAESDYAILRLSQPADPRIAFLGRLGMAPYAGGIAVLGFPKDKPVGSLWASRCSIRLDGSDATEWVSCDAGEGQYGGFHVLEEASLISRFGEQSGRWLCHKLA